MKLFFKVAVPSYILINSVWNFLFLHIVTSTDFWSEYSHPRACEVFTLLWLLFTFSWQVVMLNNFSCLFWPFVYLFCRNVFMSFANLLIGLYFKYILDTNPYQIYTLQIFSLCELSFQFLDTVLWNTKVFLFDELQFISFCCYCLCFWCHI